MVCALTEWTAANTNISQLVTRTNVKPQCDRYTNEGMCEAERIREIGEGFAEELTYKIRRIGRHEL